MIPRTIHQIWVGDLEPPAAFEAWSLRWQELHPRWSYIRWGGCPADFVVRPLWERAAEIVPARNVGQFRADILRYEILARMGGVYVDMDFEPLRPLDGFLADLGDGCCGFAAWETDGEWVNNAIMGAQPATPFFIELVEGLEGRVAKHNGRRPNKISGPAYLTGRLKERRPSRFAIASSAVFYPYRWDELERAGEQFPDAIAVHHWANRAGLLRSAPSQTTDGCVVSLETRVCFGIVCDGCADTLAEEEFIESPADALTLMAEFDWYTHDGKHYCDGCPNIPAEAVAIQPHSDDRQGADES